jgi:hypothetical protein
MMGDERVRFCQQCSLNVYNLSSMTRREAESLISNTEGRLCVRYYRRQDGTILTNNCPVGLRAIKRRLSRAASAMLSAVLSFFAGLGIYAGALANKEPSVYSNTMGTMAVPEENEVVETNQPLMGTYAVVGQMSIHASRDYARGRRLSKKARR